MKLTPLSSCDKSLKNSESFSDGQKIDNTTLTNRIQKQSITLMLEGEDDERPNSELVRDLSISQSKSTLKRKGSSKKQRR